MLTTTLQIGSNYLVSGRHVKLITYIDGTTGDPIWTLGGKLNQFTDLSGGRATDFGYQHHARLGTTNIIFQQDEVDALGLNGTAMLSMFDNHELGSQTDCTTNCSRGLELLLDFDAMTVTLHAEYFHPEHISSDAMGSAQPQAGGGQLTGWGVVPTFTQHDAAGEVVWDVQFAPWGSPPYNGNYRAFKQTWKGFPVWDPALVVQDGVAYCSWNGATEVATWRLVCLSP